MQKRHTDIVDITQIGPGVKRIHWKSGAKTDICVTDFADGPMSFMHGYINPSKKEERSVRLARA